MHPQVSAAERVTTPPEPKTATINTCPSTHVSSISVKTPTTQKLQQPEESVLRHEKIQHCPSMPVASVLPQNLPHRTLNPSQHMHQLPQPDERQSSGTTPHLIPVGEGMYIGVGKSDMDNSTARQNLVQQILTFTQFGRSNDAIAAHLNTTGWPDADPDKVRDTWTKCQSQERRG